MNGCIAPPALTARTSLLNRTIGGVLSNGKVRTFATNKHHIIVAVFAAGAVRVRSDFSRITTASGRRDNTRAGTCAFRDRWLVDGELVGGCDIIVEMFHSGELQKLLSNSVVSNDDA